MANPNLESSAGDYNLELTRHYLSLTEDLLQSMEDSFQEEAITLDYILNLLTFDETGSLTNFNGYNALSDANTYIFQANFNLDILNSQIRIIYKDIATNINNLAMLLLRNNHNKYPDLYIPRKTGVYNLDMQRNIKIIKYFFSKECDNPTQNQTNKETLESIEKFINSLNSLSNYIKPEILEKLNILKSNVSNLAKQRGTDTQTPCMRLKLIAELSEKQNYVRYNASAGLSALLMKQLKITLRVNRHAFLDIKSLVTTFLNQLRYSHEKSAVEILDNFIQEYSLLPSIYTGCNIHNLTKEQIKRVFNAPLLDEKLKHNKIVNMSIDSNLVIVASKIKETLCIVDSNKQDNILPTTDPAAAVCTDSTEKSIGYVVVEASPKTLDSSESSNLAKEDIKTPNRASNSTPPYSYYIKDLDLDLDYDADIDSTSESESSPESSADCNKLLPKSSIRSKSHTPDGNLPNFNAL